MAQTFSPVQVAREASKVAGRTVTDKQVRGAARATIARFDKTANPAYQSHAYTASERTRLVALFAQRSSKRSPAKASAKATTQTRKAQRTAKGAAQTASESPDA